MAMNETKRLSYIKEHKKGRREDRLTTQEHDEIFQRILRKYITKPAEKNELTTSDNPKAVLLGGQPGGGKGGMERASKAEMDSVVSIDPDELRTFHPRYAIHMLAEPATASGLVHRDAKRWSMELLDACIKQRYNVIYDSTLSSTRSADNLIEPLSKARYEIEVKVIAVQKTLSQQGVQIRFERKLAERRAKVAQRDGILQTIKQAEEEGGAQDVFPQHLKSKIARLQERVKQLDKEIASILPRDVPQETQDVTFEGIPEVVETLVKDDRIARIAVFGRGNVLLGESTKQNKNEKLVDVLNEKREAKLTQAEDETYNENNRTLVKFLNERAQDMNSEAQKIKEKGKDMEEGEEKKALKRHYKKLKEESKNLEKAAEKIEDNLENRYVHWIETQWGIKLSPQSERTSS